MKGVPAIFRIVKVPMRNGSDDIIRPSLTPREDTEPRRPAETAGAWKQEAQDELKLQVQERIVELCELNALLEAEQEAMDARLGFLREQMEISAELTYTIGNIDDPVHRAIASIGEFSGAHRISLFMINEDGKTMSNIHEWSAEAIASAERDSSELRNYPISIPVTWMERFKNHEVANVPYFSKIPARAKSEMETLRGQDIKSALVLPIGFAANPNGFMVLSFGYEYKANTRSTDQWDNESIQLLQIASNVVSAALERMQAEKELFDIREAQAYAQGKLEIVDTILHNIGNAINSVTIGIGTIQTNLASSVLTHHLISLANAIKEHEGDFSDYVKNDPQGQKVAPFIIALADDFAKRDEVLAKTVNRVHKRARHIADIIRTEKMLTGRSTYRKDVNLKEAIDSAIAVLQDSIARRNIKVSINCDSAPREISTHENQFHQMLVSVIKNSIEAIDDLEAASFSLRHPSIQINCYVRSDYLVLEVTDNGIGIEEDKLEAIFRPGYTTKDSGSGLGLHLTANFVNECGGRILALSDGIGKGATIQVMLPFP
jgi:signal transduction histidine kinase